MTETWHATSVTANGVLPRLAAGEPLDGLALLVGGERFGGSP
jgi:hypothetical protein